jgi:hypothetical protein
VTRQLLDHPETKDGALHGVVQNVQPDQTGVQIAVIRSALAL